MVNKNDTLKVEGLKLVGQLCLPGEGDQTPFPPVCVCHGIPSKSSDFGDRDYPLLVERVCR